jgi:hypothetical protein
MWRLFFGFMLGFAAKAVYDLFKDEPSPLGGLSTARIEALLDETRQTLREVRDDLRAAASSGSNLVQAVGQAIGGGGAVDPTTPRAAEEASAGAPAVVSNGAGGEQARAAASKVAGPLDVTPRSTRGTLETMS